MDTSSSLEQQLEVIRSTKAYEKLESFKEEWCWSKMTPNERRLLALLFVAQGREQLKHGDGKALELLDLAARIASDHPEVLYHQAEAYVTQNQNVRCLMAACKCLEAAVALNPTYFDGWSAWGTVLVRLGSIQSQMSYCQEADEKFLLAEQYSDNASKEQKGHLYWRWATCWSLMGQLSGEPCDFQKALEKYQIAAQQELNEAEFWNDYGNIVAEVGMLLGRDELYGEAIQYFHNTIMLQDDHFQAWLSLACCNLRMYASTRDEEYCAFAQEAFVKAETLRNQDMDLWLNWGRLHVLIGKGTQDAEAIQQACEKFEKADQCEANNPYVLCNWAEAQMLSGVHSERVDWLKEAEKKLIKSLELLSDNSEAWGIYGTCLTELGRYFQDENYYFQAIEKFRYALSLSPRHPLLWHGLALAYFAVGDMHDDVEMMENAVQSCAKVIEYGGDPFPQFWNDWGVALMKLGEMAQDQDAIELAIDRFGNACGEYKGEIDLLTTDLEYLYNYGCAYDFLGDYTDDQHHYERAVYLLTHVLQRNPNHGNARYNLAIALTNLGETTEDMDHFHKSLELFQQLLSTHSEDENMWNDWGMTLLNVAQLSHDQMHPEVSQSLYHQAEEKMIHAIALGAQETFYNIACLYSLMNNNAAAMHFIERAEQADVLPPIDEVLSDDWLESVRSTTEFRNFITLLSHKQEQEKP